MKSKTGLFRLKSRRGSILVLTLILCIIGALAAVWMVKTLLDHQRTNIRRRDIARAYFTAEAGIAQVLHWGNFPDDYDSGGTSGLFYPI